MAKNISSRLGVADGFSFESEDIDHISIEKLQPYDGHSIENCSSEGAKTLIQSIEKYGIIMPIIVMPGDNGKYTILSGHKRVYAAKIIGLDEIPAVVKYGLSDEEQERYLIGTNVFVI